MGRDPNAAQVEPVRVPAGLDRRVGVGPLVSMAIAGPMEEQEFVVGEIKQTPAQRHCEFGGAGAVLGVPALIEASRVVQDGEELDDFEDRPGRLGQAAAVFEDPRPVRDPMGATPRERVVLKDGLENDGNSHESRSVGLGDGEAQVMGQVNALKLVPFLLGQGPENAVGNHRPG